MENCCLNSESHNTILIAHSKESGRLVFCKTYCHPENKEKWQKELEELQDDETVWYKIGKIEDNFFINKDHAKDNGGSELVEKLTALEKL